MMLVPRKNNFDLFDDFFDDEFFPRHEFLSKKEKNLMKTDIKEKKDKYVVEVDLPGFSKENINLSLNNGFVWYTPRTFGKILPDTYVSRNSWKICASATI